MRWIFPSVDSFAITRLARELSLPPLVARLLVLRGFGDPADAQAFLNPCLSGLHDPFLMAGMRAAVARIQQAIAGREKILIYGDYDVDGTMAVVVLYTALKALGAEVETFIPHRTVDGYGMRDYVMEQAAADGYKLVLSVDTGIRESAVLGRARELGLDCVVTDHHLPGEELPPACAILNPHRADCGYPDKNLSGVGVAFKLVQALFGSRLNERQTHSYLKIVAMGTIADVVPLVGENRIIAHFGLAGLRDPVHAGLGALLEVSGLKGCAVRAGDVGFRLAPRINAAGRLDSARDVIDLFTAAGAGRVRDIAMRLDSLNRERQLVEEQTMAEIEAMIEEAGSRTRDQEGIPASQFEPCAEIARAHPLLSDRHFLIFAKEGWHRGVVGIVAQRVAERYHRPTLVMAIETAPGDGGGKVGYGSGRSISGFHLLKALESAGHLFTRFGGHAQAAGFTVDVEKLPALEAALESHARRVLKAEDLEPATRVDAELNLTDLDWNFYQALSRLEPHGCGNPTPVFAARAVRVAGPGRVIKDKHLKIKVAQGGRSFTAMAWGKAAEWGNVADRQEIDVAFTLEENTFDGLIGLELRLRDLRVVTGQVGS